MSVAVCGSTALSATLYARGRTAHSLFGIPVTEDNSELCSRINPGSDRAEYLRKVDLFVWEELPMSNKAAVECADQLLRSLTGCSLPFGRKLVVGVGDFHQVAPVVKNGGPTAALDASIRSSHLWDSFVVLGLTAPIRNASEPEFSSWVDSIGEGSSGDFVPLPRSLDDVFDYEAATTFLFGDDLPDDQASLARSSFLSPLNVHVDEFNAYILARLNSPPCK